MSHYEYLRQKWSGRHRSLQENLWKKHENVLEKLRSSSKQIIAGSLASIILLSRPLSKVSLVRNFSLLPVHVLKAAPVSRKDELIVSLLLALPKTVEPLTPEQETNVTQILTKMFKFSVTAELDGKRLNRNYGLIGAEQHLARYPGDTMATHFDNPQDRRFYSSGMAPGLGGWGYFDNSEQEKYYIAVPVFLSPGWQEKKMDLVNFFRFRKMLVVNPQNGKAIVADIGDSGPAEWTGKHLGGSPEVMSYLEREDGAARGPVLYFFINDPNNKIPLGPVAVQ